MNPKNLIGKTISEVDDSSTNIWYITFTDGTRIELDAEENALPTPYGSIPGLGVKDVTNAR